MAGEQQLEVIVDVTGALTHLNFWMKAAADLRPVLAGPINKSVDTLFIRRFETEGSYGGVRWRALAPASLRLRQLPGHGRGGIGRDTNRMWASLTKGGNGPEAIKEVTPLSLLRGTNVRTGKGFPYAIAFSGGYLSKTFVVFDKMGHPVPLFRKKPKRIPARPIVPDQIPSELLRSWERMITDFVTGAPSAA